MACDCAALRRFRIQLAHAPLVYRRPRAFGLLCALLTGLPAQAAAPSTQGLADLTLEQLANIEVTSVSKRAERLQDAVASIYVISNEAIRRAGISSLPEALRLAPNLQVARVDSRNYAIAARGFNGPFSNKLLVLIDGRTIYSPLFSGVFWDAQDVVLEDIERIEVISGPGATLWGVNAVDGVINIITRSSRDTQGNLISVDRSARQSQLTVRHGGELGNDGHYRLYAKHFQQDDSHNAAGGNRIDSLHRSQAGFRTDWARGAGLLKLQGDVYEGRLAQPATSDIAISGFNLLSRWDSGEKDGTGLHIQAYFDQTKRRQPKAFDDRLNTMDLELQYGLKPTASQSLTLGAGYRVARDRVHPTPGATFVFLPEEQTAHWSNLLVQDEITLNPRWRLILGGKLERNDYTGNEFLPSIRLAWQPDASQLWWSEWSRSVRAPSRVERDLNAPVTPPFTFVGAKDFVAEIVNVVELGYRAQPRPTLSYSFTLFHNQYKKLRSEEFFTTPAVRIVSANKIDGHATGLEAWASWQVLPNLRLSGGAVTQHKRLVRAADSLDRRGLGMLGDDPNSYWSLRSQWDISDTVALDLSVRHSGALSVAKVPAYNAVDMNLAWRPRPNLELSLAAHNLFDNKHPEFAAAPQRAELPREVFLRASYRF
ncbi:TonB-dependent receptor [Chitinimonas arctica]|uniref:TonB-dependent receptor n=1 Tax=Chitinimonas arctica TaxID=2594795 RepID=A0A516SKM2_9NEIS|nr:TonB-dependent receptor [Chitinimonas arctica]QDQ28706.1 TonB-dependent receptor [Chitinimonas arctica]